MYNLSVIIGLLSSTLQAVQIMSDMTGFMTPMENVREVLAFVRLG